MNKTIVLVTTEEIKVLFNILRPYYERYAVACGANLVILTEKDIDVLKYQHPKYYIMVLREMRFHGRVLLLDSDIFIKPGSPSIFDAFNDTSKVFMYNEFPIRGPGWKRMFEDILKKHVEDSGLKWVQIPNGVQYNGGVTLYPDDLREDLFMMPPWNVREKVYGVFKSVKQQPWRNYLIASKGVPVEDLGRRWNHLPSRKAGVEKIRESYFIHLTGFPGWNKGQYSKMDYLRNNAEACCLLDADKKKIDCLLKESGFSRESSNINTKNDRRCCFGKSK